MKKQITEEEEIAEPESIPEDWIPAYSSSREPISFGRVVIGFTILALKLSSASRKLSDDLLDLVKKLRSDGSPRSFWLALGGENTN